MKRRVSVLLSVVVLVLLPGCMLYSIESGAHVTGTGQDYTFKAGIDYDPTKAKPIIGYGQVVNTNGYLSEAEVRIKVRLFRSTGALCSESDYYSSPEPVTQYTTFGLTHSNNCSTPGGSPWFAKARIQMYNGAPYATQDTYATPKKS